MPQRPRRNRFQNLLLNSRFWILSSGIVLSVVIAGFVQLVIPSSSLQIIRIEQYYGFISIVLLYAALLVSPLTKVFPDMPGGEAYKHARRAVGVLAFYYALLHTYLTFFKQLGGFDGIAYYNARYSISLLAGIFALGVLAIMTATSLDWAVNTLGFRRWKLLHRLVYLAGLAILIHIAILGPHYVGIGFISTLTIVAVAILLWLEAVRWQQARRPKQ